MMRPLNILFSTTRQWNCGDEFILFGVRRLLEGIGVKYNAIIYNRHPGIMPRSMRRRSLLAKPELVPHFDNSFALDDLKLIDYVVFAGSPEWFGGPRINPLLDFILANRIRCAFLGVGVHRQHRFSESLQRVLREQCDIITARDPVCFDLIKEFPDSYYEVCPALFSAPEGRKRERRKRIGIVIQASRTRFHSVPEEILEKCAKGFSALEREYDVGYIAHYIDDLKHAHALGKNAFYSGYSEDYAAIYDKFDIVLSTRVHGCGIASSLGIPNALIPHDGRFQTAIKFKSHIKQPEADFVEWVNNVDVEAESSALVAYRGEREDAFRRLLLGHLSILD